MARYALMVASIVGFLLTAALTNLLAPVLHRLSLRRLAKQPILRRSRPTPPAMGGLGVMVGVMVTVAVVWLGLAVIEPRLMDGHQRSVLVLSAGFGCAFALIGFADDYLTLMHSRVMPGWLRLLLEVGVSMGFFGCLHSAGALATGTVLPFIGYVELGVFAVPLGCLMAVALLESAAVAEESQGVCSLVGFFGTLVLSAVAALQNHIQLSLYACALGGGLLAFLLWEFPPAKLTLGRTGALLIAGSLLVLACGVGWGGLLPLLGAVLLLEGATALAQRVWLALRKKKLFAAAPLHAAMSAAGWSSLRVVGTMGLAALAFAVLAMLQVINSGYLI